MWKYVSRRIRDTFERTSNHFDKRSAYGVANTQNNGFTEDSKNSSTPCRWFCPRKCWNSQNNESNTNSKRWNFEHLNSSWIGAITWSSALVLGWYASQLINLKHKYRSTPKRTTSPQINKLLKSLYPYVTSVDRLALYQNSASQIDKVVESFTPTVHLISNEGNGAPKEATPDISSSSSNSGYDLGEVLNSIENRLGLAAIENGQHKDGLNLLRSAAHRNHAPALYNLGLCYELGLGVKGDEKAAMEFYRLAASLEHPGALYNLGIYYGQGRGGLAPDTVTATRLLKLAAVKGQEDAIQALKSLHGESAAQEPPFDMIKQDWESPYTQIYGQDENVVPSQTSLFVQNNLIQTKNCEAFVY